MNDDGKRNVAVEFIPNDEGIRNLLKAMITKHEGDPAPILSDLLTPLALFVAHSGAEIEAVKAALDKFSKLAEEHIRLAEIQAEADAKIPPYFKSRMGNENSH